MSIIDRWREIELRRLAHRQGIIFLVRGGSEESRKKAKKVLRLVFDGNDVQEFSVAIDSDSALMDDPRYDFDGFLV